jgi:asparagine synthase (glutamine-hydrolysing)
MTPLEGHHRWSDPGAPATCVLLWHGRLDDRDALLHGVNAAVDDPSIALSVFEREGVDGLRRLIGDWCAVFWDARSREIVLATDYTGARPLYYCRRDDGVTWSTQLDWVAARVTSRQLDESFIGHFLSFGGHPERTPWVGIHAVPAGHYLRVTARGTCDGRLWTAPVSQRTVFRDENEYADRFRELFREAVAARLQDHAPVVAELSGGLDSSSVVCMAANLVRAGTVPAREVVTVSYVHDESADIPFIREVRSAAAVKGLELSTDRYPLFADVPTPAPCDGGWGPMYAVLGDVATRLGARTILTGQGGDLFGGNFFDDSLQVAGRLRRLRLGAALRESIQWSRRAGKPVVSILARAMWVAFAGAAGDRVVGASAQTAGDSSLTNTLLRTVQSTPVECFGEWLDAPPERRRHFFLLSLMQRLRSLQPAEPIRHFDCTHPFAHRPLAEFLLTVPVDVWCRINEPRRLMRQAMTGILPESVRNRRSKASFSRPWLRALRPVAQALLAAPECLVVERGWVENASLRHRLVRLTHGLECNEPQLRRILMLECWLRHVERAGHVPAIDGYRLDVPLFEGAMA